MCLRCWLPCLGTFPAHECDILLGTSGIADSQFQVITIKTNSLWSPSCSFSNVLSHRCFLEKHFANVWEKSLTFLTKTKRLFVHMYSYNLKKFLQVVWNNSSKKASLNASRTCVIVQRVLTCTKIGRELSLTNHESSHSL